MQTFFNEIKMSRTLSFIFVFFTTVSCGGKEINKMVSTNSVTDSTVVNKEINTIKQEIPEMGLLKQVEDSGYPFAILTIEFPERNFTENFTINMEEVDNASIADLNSYIDHYVKFTYTSELSYALLDIFHNSRSIFGAEVAPEGDAIKAIEGILYGAEQVTNGDLPGEVSVFADDGENHYFPYFVTSEMVAVNEKRVTAFYEVRTSNTITSIQMVR
jgi:hypothetical protein